VLLLILRLLLTDMVQLRVAVAEKVVVQVEVKESVGRDGLLVKVPLGERVERL